MQYEVLSREAAKRYARNNHSEKSIMISISDSFQTHPTIECNENNKIKDVIFLHFDDVEKEDLFAYPQSVPVDSIDAKRISHFVMLHKNDVDKIIVHCGAGISRSSGVCAAIMKAFTGSDFEIFNNKKFCPNMTCYRLCLNALMEEMNR